MSQNTFLGLGHSAQKRVLIYDLSVIRHGVLQYSCVSILSEDKFHAMLMREHPEMLILSFKTYQTLFQYWNVSNYLIVVIKAHSF